MTEPAWYIDALDGFGGIAFASQRTADLNNPDPALDKPAWVITAPAFQPEPVTSRATGFAATKRGLQFGFSTNGETEVAFPSLVALTSFVRRLFLSGGGRDGPGGIIPPDGGPPTGPDGGDREPSEPPPSLMPYKEALLGFALSHRQASEALGDGDTGAGIAQATDPLGTPEAGETQLNEPGFLDLVDDLIGSELVTALNNALGGPGPIDPNLIAATEAYFAVALSLRIRAFSVASLDDQMIYLVGMRFYAHNTDMLDILSRLPVPRWINASSNATETWLSVKDLFFDILANPRLLDDTRYPTERIVLFLFAAAAFVARGRLPGLIIPGRDTAFAPLHSTLSDTFDWLKEQMPTIAFTQEIEDLIQAAGREPPRPEAADRVR